MDCYTTLVQGLYQRQQIGKGTSETVNRMDVDGVPLANVLEHCLKLGAVCSRTAHFVREQLINLYAIQLTVCVLVNRANANVSDLCHFPITCIH
ncbi:hypothetical protein D9M70_642740 [compost metagenome]